MPHPNKSDSPVNETVEAAGPVVRRLNRPPIIEAVCQVVFRSSVTNPSAILPGMLFQALRDKYETFESLPASSLPAEIRERDPNLRSAPLYQLRGTNGLVQLGERTITVSAIGVPYQGWSTFRGKVEEALNAAAATGLISGVDRISVKYTNLLAQGDDGALSELTSVSLQLGPNKVDKQPAEIKSEIHGEGHVTLVTIMSRATVNQPGKEPMTGLVLDVDTIRMKEISEPVEKLMPLFDEAHAEEKRIFFSLLSPSSLRKFEPEYEQNI